MSTQGQPHLALLLSVAGALALLAFIGYIHGVQGSGLLYDFFILPFLYVGVIILLADFIAKTPLHLVAALSIVVGSLLIVGVASIPSPGHGYPAPGVGGLTIQSCTTEQYTNSTFGYVIPYAQCSSVNGGTAFWSNNLLLDFLYWLPASGLVVYALPTWRKGEKLDLRAARIIACTTLLAATLVPLLNVLPLGSS